MDTHLVQDMHLEIAVQIDNAQTFNTSETNFKNKRAMCTHLICHAEPEAFGGCLGVTNTHSNLYLIGTQNHFMNKMAHYFLSTQNCCLCLYTNLRHVYNITQLHTAAHQLHFELSHFYIQVLTISLTVCETL